MFTNHPVKDLRQPGRVASGAINQTGNDEGAVNQHRHYKKGRDSVSFSRIIV